MKIRLFVKGDSVRVEGQEYPQTSRGPLWCEITFVGDGTPGNVEFLFDGKYWISTPESLARYRTLLLERLEGESSLRLAGETICDGKTIMFTTRSEALKPWTYRHVGQAASSLGNFILEWPEPPPPERLPSPPKPDPELEDRIKAAMDYQKKIREEYRQTGQPPTNDPFEFSENVEKKKASLEQILARRRGPRREPKPDSEAGK